MSVNKYFPFAFIYFFINSLGLPFGLTYTALLAPLFYVWIILVRKKEILLPYLAIMLPFIIIHYTVVGVDTQSYFISLLNFTLVYIFAQAAYTFFKTCDNIEKIFRWILIINFFLCLIAIPFYFSKYYSWFWDQQLITGGVGDTRRLRMFTYEPSYYAFIFTPLFFYFIYSYFFRQNRIPAALLLLMIFLPYILSFSIGVIGSVFIAGLLTGIIYFVRLTSKRRVLNAYIYAGAIITSTLMVLVLFFRQNPVFTRLTNIFKGQDSSGRGRTTEAFILAQKILEQKNEVFGIGLGQIKILGENIIRDYYFYFKDITVTIPNATAETLAIFGWAGLVIRFSLEVFLFFHTKVWRNYYRLSLFLFVFIYQFTGSFITNVAEYVIWILAFTNVFPQFDVRDRNIEKQEATN